MIFLAVTHAILLCGIAILGARKYCGPAVVKWNVAFLLVWFSLEGTGYLLGFSGLLNNLPAYIVATFFFALLGFRFLHGFRAQAIPELEAPAGDTRDVFERRLIFACKGLAALAILGTIIIALSYYPNNPDSVAYRFARVMLYLGQGNIHHPATTDPRLSFYPLNGVFLYIPDAIYALDQRIFTLTGFACWLIGGTTVYALARELRVSTNAAFFGATLYLLAPAILVSASSTNDDFLSGVPLAAGILFFLRWQKSRAWVDAVLAGTAFGTSFGVKLHFLFYLPLVVVFALTLLLSSRMRDACKMLALEQLLQICAIIALAIGLSFPALAINFADSGRLMPPVPENMNSPFSFASAAVNSVLYTAQLFLAPMADLLVGAGAEARKHAIEAYIGFFNAHFFFWVNNSFHYAAEMPNGRILATFSGVADPLATLGVAEEEVWVGFLPWALALATYVAFRMRKTQPAAPTALWLCVGFFLWHLGRCVFSKYVPSAGIYYAFAIVPACAALAWLWQIRSVVSKRLATTIVAVLVFTLIGEAGSAVSSVAFSPDRNLVAAAKNGFAPRPDAVSDDLRACIAASNHVQIAQTHWEIRNFAIMEANMRARYSAPLLPSHAKDVLAIILYPRQSQFGDIPVQIGGARARHLTLLGTVTSENGSENAFVTSPSPACQSPAQSGYIALLTLPLRRDHTGIVTAFTIRAVIGLAKNYPLEFKVLELLPDRKQLLVSDWTKKSSLRGSYQLPLPAKDGSLAFYVRDPGWRGTIRPTLFPLQRGGNIVLPSKSN